MPHFLSSNKNKGFSMIEVIFAILIITIGVVGAFSAIPRILSYTSISASRLVAAYLAQEGIEIVRNIRDTNWIENNDWEQGLTEGDWEAGYNDQGLSSGGRLLKVDDNGFYNYDVGTDTKFKRKISILPLSILPQGNTLMVSVLVEWQEGGASHNISAQEILYNWYLPSFPSPSPAVSPTPE